MQPCSLWKTANNIRMFICWHADIYYNSFCQGVFMLFFIVKKWWSFLNFVLYEHLSEREVGLKFPLLLNRSSIHPGVVAVHWEEKSSNSPNESMKWQSSLTFIEGYFTVNTEMHIPLKVVLGISPGFFYLISSTKS